MKRLLTAAVAISLLGGTAAMADPPHGHYDNGRHNGWDHGGKQQHHRWARGERLPSNYYSDRGYWVDYRAHHLRAPPRGYRWVRVDNDYMLVAATTGLIASIIAGSSY